MLLLALLAHLGRCPHPSDCHPAGQAGPYVSGGPVGPDGTLSPFLSDHAGPAGRHVAVGPVGPFGTLSPSDCCPAAPAGPYVAGAHVGPDGTLSLFTSDHAGPAGWHVAVSPVGSSGTLSPSTSGSAILVDPGGNTLLPGEGGPKFCPGVLTDDLVLGAAVPLPAVRDPRVASSPGEVLVGNADVITNGNIAGHDGWSDPEMVGSSSAVVKVGCAALPRSTDTTLVCVDECTECDILDQFVTINGMPVYYGGDLYDSEDSDWDDPYEIAGAAYVEDYNFDVPEGMDLMIHELHRGPYSSDIREDQQTGLTHVCQTSLCDTRDELDTVDVESLTEAFAEDVQDTDDFYQRDEEDFGDPDDGSSADNDGHPGLTPVCQTLFCDPRDVLDTVDVDSVMEGFAEKLPGSGDFYQEMVSSDEEDFSESDDGSVENFENNTWTDWCGSAFETAFGAGYCRTITWEERYLPCLHPPCVVERLCSYITKIKVPVFVPILDRNRDISPRRCACMCGTSLGVLSSGRIPLMVIGCFTCGGAPVDCSDWTRMDCAVDFSPGKSGSAI